MSAVSWKLSCCVLRGLTLSNGSGLLGNEAIETANQAIALNPHSEEAYETKVYPLFQLRREEELTAVLEEIIVLNPHTPLRGFLNYLRADRGKVNY